MGRISPAYRAQSGPHSLDRAVAELAGRQYGVVSGSQLRALGASKGAVERRVAAGRLHRLYRGVYAVGHAALTRDARHLAAVLACGTGALLSHRAAGHHRVLLRGAQPIEVTVRRGCAPKRGIVLHRTRAIGDEDRDVVAGIPATSVARTIVDLADVLTERRLADAVHEAEFQRVLDVDAIERALARVPGRRGRHRLERVLGGYAPLPQRTRNDAERAVLRLCERHGLPPPQTNASVDGYEVDFLWPQTGLIAELDGGAAHLTRRAFHEDRARDRVLATKGFQVLRLTWRDVEGAPAEVARQLGEVHRRRQAPRT